MQLIRGQRNLTRRLQGCVVTLGNFDGLHKGHQQLIGYLKQRAQALNLPAVVITFEPQPQEFFRPEPKVPRLMRFHEKWQTLKELGIDYLVCLRFNSKLAAFSAEDFVEKLLIDQLNMKSIVIGDDFKFGANRSGDGELLKQLGVKFNFEVLQLPACIEAGQRISSTRIRRVIQANNLELASKLLGRFYFLCGKIVSGDQRGRQLGFPTANIHLSDKAVCVSGIYVVKVSGLTARSLPAVASVGHRPMFNDRGVILEVHLLDFNTDIYGRFIKVEFLTKLRDEQCFETMDALISQMRQDVEQTRQFFISNSEVDHDGSKKTTQGHL